MVDTIHQALTRPVRTRAATLIPSAATQKRTEQSSLHRAQRTPTDQRPTTTRHEAIPIRILASKGPSLSSRPGSPCQDRIPPGQHLPYPRYGRPQIMQPPHPMAPPARMVQAPPPVAPTKNLDRGMPSAPGRYSCPETWRLSDRSSRRTNVACKDDFERKALDWRRELQLARELGMCGPVATCRQRRCHALQPAALCQPTAIGEPARIKLLVAIDAANCCLSMSLRVRIDHAVSLSLAVPSADQSRVGVSSGGNSCSPPFEVDGSCSL